MEGRAAGLYHVVDDEPVTVADLFAYLAERLGAPTPRRVPARLARFLVGPETVAMMTQPSPTNSARFREATGWEPRYPTYREGIDQVIKTWLHDGTLRETDDGYEWVGD